MAKKQHASTVKRHEIIKADYDKLIKTYRYTVVMEKMKDKYGYCERSILRIITSK